MDSSRPQPKPELALNIFNYMMVSCAGMRVWVIGCMEWSPPLPRSQLHPLCCEEMKKLKETWELEKTLQKCLVHSFSLLPSILLFFSPPSFHSSLLFPPVVPSLSLPLFPPISLFPNFKFHKRSLHCRMFWRIVFRHRVKPHPLF